MTFFSSPNAALKGITSKNPGQATRYKVTFNDGLHSKDALLSSQVCDLAASGALVHGTIIRVREVNVTGVMADNKRWVS